MRLTRRGIGVLLAVPLLYLIGELLAYALFRAAAGATLAVLVAAAVIASRRPRVEVGREVYPDRVERGRSAIALLQVHNPRSRRHPAFAATDGVGDQRRQMAIRDLAPRSSVTQRYPLPTGRRGRFDVGPLVLERADPLGLVRRIIVAGNVEVLRVHPRRHPVRTVQAGWPRHHYNGSGIADPLSGTTDLRQIREYVPGDEVRFVHWKALARTGSLMVREYTDPAEPRLTIVLDNRTEVVAPEPFEEIVELAASFVCAALGAGFRTRIVTTCGDLDAETNAGLDGAGAILDRLTDLHRATVNAVDAGVTGGAVVFASAGAGSRDPGVLAGLTAGRPTSVFDLDVDDCGAPWPVGVHAISAPSAADAVAEWNRIGTP